jgi:predicted O-methyltransferase YrrM
MDDPLWKTADAYLAEHLAPPDDALRSALETNARAGLPAIDVSPLQGKLLHLFALAIGAKQVLEIGTLGGYSTIWLARALPPGGRLVTLEVDPAHAAVARENLERAGLSAVVELRLGPAAETLPRLQAEGYGPFDLIFIDADKPSNAEYVQRALELSRPARSSSWTTWCAAVPQPMPRAPTRESSAHAAWWSFWPPSRACSPRRSRRSAARATMDSR